MWPYGEYSWNATLKKAIHIGNDHDVNMRNVLSYVWRSTGQLFGEIEKVDQCVKQRLLEKA